MKWNKKRWNRKKQCVWFLNWSLYLFCYHLTKFKKIMELIKVHNLDNEFGKLTWIDSEKSNITSS